MAEKREVRSERVLLNISPTCLAVLMRLAAAQDKSLSGFTADILEEAVPNLLRLAKLAEGLQGKRRQAFGVIPKGA